MTCECKFTYGGSAAVGCNVKTLSVFKRDRIQHDRRPAFFQEVRHASPTQEGRAVVGSSMYAWPRLSTAIKTQHNHSSTEKAEEEEEEEEEAFILCKINKAK